MAIWLPFKAKPHEMKNRTRKTRPERQRFCRICGKPIQGMEYCQSCGDFIRRRKHEERQGKK